MALGDEQLDEAFERGYDDPRRSDAAAQAAGLRAVEAAVREDALRELAAGVDVEHLAVLAEERLDECSSDEYRIVLLDLFRTAVAQARAAEAQDSPRGAGLVDEADDGKPSRLTATGHVGRGQPGAGSDEELIRAWRDAWGESDGWTDVRIAGDALAARLAERGRENARMVDACRELKEERIAHHATLQREADAIAERDALRAVADDAHRDVASLRAEVERLRAWIASAPIGRSGQP